MKESDNKYRYVHGCYFEDDYSGTLVMNVKNVETNESKVRIIKDPKRPIWITKPQYRTFTQTRECSDVHECDMFVVPQKELARFISKHLGLPSWTSLRKACRNPFVHAGDIDVRMVVKKKYKDSCAESPTAYKLGALDIENSVLGGREVIVITYIDASSQQIFTGILKSFMPEGVTVDQIKAMFWEKIPEFRNNLKESARALFDKNEFKLNMEIIDGELELIRWIFDKIHKCKPDFVSTWSTYDVTYILERLTFHKINPKHIFCHPSIPDQYKFFNYEKDKRSLKKGHWTDKWDWVYASGYTQFVDAMCLYSRNRKAAGREPSYKLNDVCTKCIGAGKIDFGNDNHYTMQKFRFPEYVVYNIFDVLLMNVLEAQEQDIPTLIELADDGLLSDYAKQSVQLKNFWFDYCSSIKKVPGSVGGNVALESDEEISNTGGTVLSPLLAIDTGVPAITESDRLTGMHICVCDMDVESQYPSLTEAANISKQTKVMTVIDIMGYPKSCIEDFFLHAADTDANAVYLGSKYFGLPTFDEMLDIAIGKQPLIPSHKLFVSRSGRRVYSGTIQHLPPSAYYVFGSNTEGRHGKGAAKVAVDKFGAIYGRPRGIQGRSYAIVTKDLNSPKDKPSIPISDIMSEIATFYRYANAHEYEDFYVAYSGTGSNLNNYTPDQMAKMFVMCGTLPVNVIFEASFLDLMENYTKEITWSRTSNDGYEVSTEGDATYSALNARLLDGRTIEQAYQLDVKGYRDITENWRDGKGKPPVNNKTMDQCWDEYLGLWLAWAKENPNLVEELRDKVKGRVLTDKFATSKINQARALATVLNMRAGKVKVDEPKVYNTTDPYIPPGAVYIGRGSPYGNPFVLGRDGDRNEVCDAFEEDLKYNSALIIKIKAELEGKHLLCHCAPERCHGDFILKVANTDLYNDYL